MNFCLVFALFGYFFAWSEGMLYRRDSDNVLKPEITRKIINREIGVTLLLSTVILVYLCHFKDEFLFGVVLFGFFFAWSEGMLSQRDSDYVLKPDLMPVSSTVLPLPYYSIYGYEKKLLRDKNNKRPQGKISLVTKEPK